MLVIHNFKPIYDENTEILILGSFPSVKSREQSFYYMNKYNRFWKVLSNIYNINFVDVNIEEKERLLKENKIGLHDVIYSCEINGSADSTIKNVTPVDLKTIIEHSNIKKIYLNGNKAYELFKKYFKEYLDISIVLPSTSPANARFSLDKLIDEWKIIKK